MPSRTGAFAQSDPAVHELQLSLSARYSDGYTAANILRKVGNGLKTVALVLGVLGVVCVLVVLRGAGREMPLVALIPVILSVALGGGMAYLGGIFIAAQGDILDAVLDTAVNTSPLLDDSAKLRLIGVDGTTQSNAAGSPRICTNCKNPVAAEYADARFCEACGTPLPRD